MYPQHRGSGRIGQGLDLSAANDNQRPAPWGLVNFYSGSDQPWLPADIFTSTTLGSQSDQSLSTLNPPSFAFQNYRSLPSDCSTLPGDSGYGSNYHTFSIDGASSVHEDDSGVDTGPMEQLLRGFGVDQEQGLSQMQPPPRTMLTHRCEDCGAYVKTKSELNKHSQRHNKPHRCSYKDCERAKEGFSTSNDLVRHRRTVHREHLQHGPVFICRHEPCISKDRKLWPRADNFRSHLARSHQEKLTAEDDLSSYLYQPTQTSKHDLRGIGTSVADVDPDSRPMDLQDSPILREASASTYVDSLINISFRDENLRDTMSTSNNLLRQLDTPVTHEGSGYIQPYVLNEQNDENPPSSLLGKQQAQALSSIEGSATVSDSPVCTSRDDITLDTPTIGTSSKSGETDRESEIGQEATWSSHHSPCSESGEPELDQPSNIGTDSQPRLCNTKDTLHLQQLLSTAMPGGISDRRILVKILQSLPKELLQTALKGEGEECEKDSSAQDDSSTKALHRCPECEKRFGRPCELKKHMKRHEKPYGCTFRQCSKLFGSKNDWKRHESSQHYQLETWTCDLPDCLKVCHRRESFKSHLHKDHMLESMKQLVEDKLESCRLGRHCDPRFWCGFCEQIIEIKETGVNSWTKRCDHIDNHLFGKDGLEKKRISEWKYLEAEDKSEPVSLEKGAVKQYQPSRTSTVENQEEHRKRKSKDDSNPRKSKRRDRDHGCSYMWSCCNCCAQNSWSTLSSCIECNLPRCSDCGIERVMDPIEEDPILVPCKQGD